VHEAFQKASAELGAPEALIATVGGVRGWKSISETNLEDFRYLLDLNTVTAFLALKHGMQMVQRPGSMITIGAEPALKPAAHRGAYASSKAAVINLTLTAAEEGKELGIRANCLIPHTIDTPANREWGSPEAIPKWTDPRDIAELCYHLSSPAGKAVNGSVIRVPHRM
jgi:NAD(P)-dependent dehydrogenase (short-subunit alcohol dehydrogenase family)